MGALPLLAAFALLLTAVGAVPLHGGTDLGGPSVSPLVAALTLLPFPFLAALKFGYMRFRRGQSIHAHPHAISPSIDNFATLPCGPPEPSAKRLSPAGFWFAVTPYLVGFLGSPLWETTIRSRLDKTIRQSKSLSRRSSRRSSPPFSPALADSQTSRFTGNTSTAYYSSLSHKSRSRSRSKSLSVSFGDTSADSNPRLTAHGFSAITDCSIIHPSTPPCQHATLLPMPPQPAHTLPTVRNTSLKEHSPTLMQVMEPVLASWYDNNPNKPNDASHSSANTSRERSASSGDSPSHPFQTPMTSPASPGMPGALSVPSLSFTLFRKQLGPSSTSSAFSLSTTTLPSRSPNTVSLAVFHTGIPPTPSLLVPKLAYTTAGSIRPESYGIDWHANCNKRPTLLQSPTHRSPAPGAAPACIYDVLDSSVDRRHTSPKVSFSPTLAPPAAPLPPQATGAAVLKSALRKPSAGASPTIPSSLRNSVSFSLLSVDSGGVPSTGPNSATGLLDTSTASKKRSWDMSDLLSNGELDVDAVTRILGLGLGVGSRSSVGSIESSVSGVRNLQAACADACEDAGESEEEYDIEQYAAGWGSPRMPQCSVTGMSMQMQMHVLGQPLTVIPEETRSEVCSIAGSVHFVGGAARSGDDLDGSSSRRLSGATRAESWREGESAMTLNVGIAW
ncbi:hypothetical protein C8Q79DRAFT_996446 [Trametes meyenii]|nr:hypothetical protein C8Q79DRAFT_996446 [Trametes meyenii]